jgi:hypothetical protein
MMEGNTPDFTDKVRFARLVEECLREPALAPAPHLGLRVRERLMLEEVRRTRRSAISRSMVYGAALVLLIALPCAAGWTTIQGWVHAFVRYAPALAAAEAFSLALHSPLAALGRAPLAGMATLTALLAGLFLFLLRDLFTDPFQGLSVRRLTR